MTPLTLLKKLFLSASTLAALTFFVASCKNNTRVVPAGLSPAADKSLYKILSETDSLSLLKSAVDRLGLSTALKDSTGTFTLFAPTNAAFKKLGIGDEAAVNLLDLESLKSLIQYHVVVTAAYPLGVVPLFNNLTLTTLGGKKIFLTRFGNAPTISFYVNQLFITAANRDRKATNGVMHLLGSVLTPPTQTIKELIADQSKYGVNGNLSLLSQAISSASKPGARNNLDSLLSDTSSYKTLIAPTNEAFVASGITNLSAVSAANLLKALQLHVFSGIYFTSNFGALKNIKKGTLTIYYTPTLLSGQSDSIKTTTPRGIKGPSSDQDFVSINPVDIIATNGVIHVIRKEILRQK